MTTLAVHFGAHKTATTALQARLARNAPQLGARGIGVVETGAVREALSNPVRDIANLPRSGTGRARADLKQGARRFINGCAGPGLERVVISDENLIGLPFHVVREAAVYPHVARRAAALANILEGWEVELFFAIRSFADFFASCHCENLRLGHIDPFGPLKARLLEHGAHSWTSLIGAFRAAFPQARMAVWRYEDLPRLDGEIMRKLCGVDEGFAFTHMDLQRRPSFSHRMVDELMALSGRDGHAGAASRIPDLARRYPKGAEHRAFDPWSAGERAELDRNYDQDCMQIEKNWPGLLMNAEKR